MFQHKTSQAASLSNAVVLVHGYSPDTAILHLNSTKDTANQAAIWVNRDELKLLGEMLIKFSQEAF